MTRDEKMAKVEEAAFRNAEKDDLDETVKEMGVYIVSVDANPSFCGVGAGGIQFANGRAEIANKRMKTWFEEHEGYTVQAKE